MNSNYINKLLAGLFVSLLLATSVARAAPILDVIVLMDGSGSIDAAEYELQKDAVAHLFDSFTISPTETRFGLITYSTDVVSRSGLSGSALALDSALGSASQSYGQTNHGGALAAAATELDANARGGEVQKVVILLTDGEANRPDGGPLDPLTYAVLEANNLKNNEALIFTLGFGSLVDGDDLSDLSSGPDYNYLVDDFDGGIGAIDDIVAQLNSLSGPAPSVDSPPAMYLLSLGLLGLAMRRRRRTAG